MNRILQGIIICCNIFPGVMLELLEKGQVDIQTYIQGYTHLDRWIERWIDR